MTVSILHGDSRELLKGLADNSIDSVCCDPPYALVSIGKRFGAENAAPAKAGKTGAYARASKGFMGKTWDNGSTAFDPDFWREVYRVLKPGAHLVAFGGTRTYHRLAVAIEDAGFEVRDMLSFLYGSGFPKSHDVSKGIDKANGHDRKVIGKRLSDGGRSGSTSSVGQSLIDAGRVIDITSAASAASSAWEGWGTALKPACEPIVLARKPLDGTVAANVLKWGTGALNIDGCRIEGEKTPAPTSRGDSRPWLTTASGNLGGDDTKGRWPANVITDGSDEVVGAFPQTDGGGSISNRASPKFGGVYGDFHGEDERWSGYADEGSAARFFYSAKAGPYDRFASKHPTVKPVELMRWLCRLVTPPGGTVLDPFAGSGTTGAAAMIERFDCILMEREAEYVADIERRMAWMRGDGPLTDQVLAERAPQTTAGPLFDGEAA